MWSHDNKVSPLVYDRGGASANLWDALFLKSRFPYIKGLSHYYLEDDIRKNESGEFITAVELKQLLTPHANLINEPDACRWRILYSFFTRISSDNHKEINESRLAKVIVLLQFLANPDLTMIENNVPRLERCLLKNAFINGPFGLDTLNLLFSYGLTYETFLEEKQLFKDSDVYPPILDIQKDNPYEQAYQKLCLAYQYYQEQNYLLASASYEEASVLLTAFESHSDVLTNDYAYRAEKCRQYDQICLNLEQKNNRKISALFFSSHLFSKKNSPEEHSKKLINDI